MNTKLVAIFIAGVVIVGGGAYAIGVAQGQGNKKANESAAMMKQKDQDTAAMKKDAEGDAMKKKEEDAAMKKAEGDAMHKTESPVPAQ